MSNNTDGITVTRIQDIEAYAGPGAIDGIRFRAARPALGVSSWGMNIIELDAGCTDYPEHDHAGDGQEEVYLIVSGAAVLVCDGEERSLTQGDLVRVAPELKRKFITGDEPVTMLALGGTPGQKYTPGMGG